MVKIYIYGILYRSESLVNGFLKLAENNNFICAISLIRLQLDGKHSVNPVLFS